MSAPRYDVAVVGSGLGGLSAAAYLAAAGQRVGLLERYSVLGGSSHVYRRQGRWEFDCGVHYIGDCGPGGAVPTLLHGLGLDEHVEFLPLDADGFDTIIGPDLELRVPVGWDRYLANLIASFPGEDKALRRYVGVMQRLADSFDRTITPSSAKEFAKSLARAGTAAPWAMAPLAGFMIACGLKPRTILALSVQCGAMATTPLSAPVAAMATFLQNFVGHGAYYPRGGGQMLAAGFAEVIRAHGGEIRTNATVEKIVTEGGRVTGVRLVGGEAIHAGAVVSDADIIRTYRELVGFENLPRATRLRVRSWQMSRPLINAFFGAEIDIQRTPNTNYYAIPTWDDAASLLSLERMTRDLLGRSQRGRDRLDWAAQFAARQPMFIQSSTRRDPGNERSAPKGHAALEVQTLVPPAPHLWGYDGYDPETGDYRNDAKYREMKKVVTDAMLHRLEQAYPGVSSTVKVTELGTPATQTRFTATTTGAAFGLDQTVTQTGPLRPGVRTGVPGLYLAGTSTAWGPGTEGAMVSGMYAAAAVLGRDLAHEVRQGAVIADRSRLRNWASEFDPLTDTSGLARK
jgi:all-trans-retinol 13,14-reductase